ncbi:head-tail connector protein, partial [Bacillus cereus]|nr:head-tail connector protein [Bacillus cereus]
MNDLIEKLKSHIHWEEGMDETMLSFYIEQAKTYVKNATGKQTEYLIVMVAGIFYDYRVAEKELEHALD